MNQNYLIKQKYLIGPSYFYYIYTIKYLGRFLLIVPMTFAILMASLWGNYDYFWVGPIFGWIGWYLLVSLNYVKSLRQKNFIARHDFIVRHLSEAGPVVVGVCLYCVLLRLNVFGLVGPSEHSIPKSPEQIPLQFDLAQQGSHLRKATKLAPSREPLIEGDA